MTVTNVDTVVSALVAGLRADMPTVTVLDGPRAAQDLRDDTLTIGSSANSETAESYNSITTDEVFGDRRMEEITITVEATAWSDAQDDELGPARARVVNLIYLADAYLRAGGLAAWADVVLLGDRTVWYGIESPDGPGVGATFTVVARTFLDS